MAAEAELVALMQAFRAAIGHVSDELSVLAASVRGTNVVYTADEVADMLGVFAANIEATADETIARRDKP